MENPITLALFLKFLVAVLLILGGIAALYFGFRLFMSGVGLTQDGSTIDAKKVKANLKTVGATVMATSVAWGFLGYLASPNYAESQAGKKVGKATEPLSLSIESLALETQADPVNAQALTNAAVIGTELGQVLREHFSKATNNHGEKIWVMLHGYNSEATPLHFIAHSRGSFAVKTFLEQKKKGVTIDYETTLNNGRLIFRPRTITIE